MIDSNRLFKTTFSKDLTEDSKTLAMRLFKKQKSKSKALDKTKRGEYIHQVLDSFSELNSIVDNLDMAEIFLKSYSVSKAWRNKYDQNHYFTYHYEIWIINAIRFYERLLILINSVYWLEIDHRNITYKEVVAHKKLKNTDTLKVLNRVHGALSNLQGLKNSVFHRYIYTDKELGEITRYNFLARNSEGKEKEQFSIMAKLKMKYMYLPKKKKEVENNNKQLMKAADALMETFDRPYANHRDSLSDK